ncbi:hypothetical protein C4565_06675 [Candidatus Parcubacteria bacterium]|nr:MAG: hypothetical protein C4565_06675 [Candidatus Parcubacteria bacterium]
MKNSLWGIIFQLLNFQSFNYNKTMETRNYSEALNEGYKRLHSQIEVERAKPENAEVHEREIVKKSVVSVVQSIKKTQPTEEKKEETQSELHVIPQYAEQEPEALKKEIETLVELAANKGLEQAVQVSLKCSSFVQDAFHDALVDNLVPELKKRGMI